MFRPKISVVVCAKNEGERIRASLECIKAVGPDEIVVVDGNSSDNTAAIAREYTDHVVISDAGSLTRDRQVGIDAATHDLIAMIDADHRIKPGDLEGLWHDMEEFGFHMVQSLIGIEDKGFWCRAESEAFDVFLNTPGPKKMIGTAPALYKREIFSEVQFDDHITRNKDDADFIYRLYTNGKYKFGHGRTYIWQEHFCAFREYVKKFAWYGRGDAEFCRKHMNRAPSMFFHLFIRYPVLRPLKALFMGKFRAIPYLVVCGLVRGFSMTKALLLHLLKGS